MTDTVTGAAASAARRRTPLVAYLVANTVSLGGTRISAIAIPWLVLTTTGSASKTGLAALCEMAPLVVTKALGGPIIDRLGPRRVSVVTDATSAGLVALIPVLHLLGMLSFPALLGLVAAAGVTRGPADAAKGTMVPDIAEDARVPLERVTGLDGSTDRISTMVAPAVAGIVIGIMGPANALLADAASFGVCAVLLAVWGPSRHTSEASTRTPYLRQLHEGWRFLSREKLLRAITGMVCVTNLLDAAFMSVLLPVWVHRHGMGPEAIGFILSAFGATATVGSLLAAVYGDRLPRRATYLIGFFIGGAPRFVVLALGLPLGVVIGVWAAGGIGSGFINPIISAILIERVPRALLGRVNALIEALAWSGIPLGPALAGAALAGAGLAPVLVAAGAIYAVATTVPGLLPQWKDMRRHSSA